MINQPLDALVAPTLEAHPELRDKAAALINTALDEAAKMLTTGDVAQRAQMLKYLLPAVFKASTTTENTTDSIRAEFDALRAEFRSALFTRTTVTEAVSDPIPFDRPRRLTGSAS